MNVLRAAITADRLDVHEYGELVQRRAAGAVVSFAGIVRDHDHDRDVSYLEYEAHPTATEVIADVAASGAAREGVMAVALAHRYGRLEISEAAVVCAVSAAHRVEAFEACQWLVDEVKRVLPVWKRQVFSDGTDEWVNCP